MPMLLLPFSRTTVASVRPVPSMLASALVLALSATAATPVAAQQAGSTSDAPQTLDSVVVTGSRLRRVDTETANPVITVSQEQIAATGKATVGDLLQELPSIAGNATNPYTNNGGGTGAWRFSCAAWAISARWCWSTVSGSPTTTSMRFRPA